jgi:excisionase family DNA binding protein
MSNNNQNRTTDSGTQTTATGANPNERLMRVLQATPAQLAAIDRLLDGKPETAKPERKGPFLIPVREAAALLGVHRTVLWRMTKAGRLARVEILPGSYRVRREDVEAIAFGKEAA